MASIQELAPGVHVSGLKVAKYCSATKFSNFARLSSIGSMVMPSPSATKHCKPSCQIIRVPFQSSTGQVRIIEYFDFRPNQWCPELDPVVQPGACVAIRGFVGFRDGVMVIKVVKSGSIKPSSPDHMIPPKPSSNPAEVRASQCVMPPYSRTQPRRYGCLMVHGNQCLVSIVGNKSDGTPVFEIPNVEPYFAETEREAGTCVLHCAQNGA